MKIVSSGFCDHCLVAGCNLVIGQWEENWFVHYLFCIFNIISGIGVNIYFVLLLNYLYLNSQVLSFVHSPSYPTGGKGRGEWAAV